MPIAVVGGCLEQLEQELRPFVLSSEFFPCSHQISPILLSLIFPYTASTLLLTESLLPIFLSLLPVPTFPTTTEGILEAWSMVITARGVSGESSISRTRA